MHSRRASLKPWHSERSDWFWAHRMKSLISAAHGPLISVVAGPVGAASVGGAAVVASGVVVAVLLEPPPKIPVMAWPATWPTADPTATPPAVAAIWKI